MWIINNGKAQSQTYLKYDMQNLMTQLNNAEHRINSIITLIDRVAGGAPSGQGNILMNRCCEAKNSLEEVRQLLNTCCDCVSQLDVMEWQTDD